MVTDNRQPTTDNSRRVIDAGKEFNQTNEHDHRGDRACWCGFGVGSEQPADFARMQPASVTSERIRELEAENKMLRRRIEGFERVSGSLAAELDKLLAGQITDAEPLKAA